MNREAFNRALNILRTQKLSYVTKNIYVKVFNLTNPGDFPRQMRLSSHRKALVYDCPALSRQLIANIKNDESLIRKLNSKSTTNQLSYGDIIQVPGTHNYREVFHYKHRLTPEDKHQVQQAIIRIKKDRGTYKLKPNLSPTAAVYMIPNKTELWKNKLIFVNDLIKWLKINWKEE